MAIENSTWGLIGAGGIGGEVQRQLADPETATRLGMQTLPNFVMRSSGIYDAAGHPFGADSLADIAKLPDVVFVATPSTDDGVTTYNYLTHLLSRGTSVVTAEKGAVANFLPQLREASGDLKRLGMSATVGGGTRLLHELRTYCSDPGNVSQIHLALNGTLAAIFSSMAPPKGEGLSFDAAVQRAVDLGYAEPGSASPLDVIRAEAEGDIPKKVGILFNYLGLSPKGFDWNRLKFSLKDGEIQQAAAEAEKRRFIVSIYPENSEPTDQQEDIIGGFDIEHDGWRIVGGFQNVESNAALGGLAATTGPNNGFVVGLGPNSSHGVYSLSGPGAGVRPTVSSMLHDHLTMKTLN